MQLSEKTIANVSMMRIDPQQLPSKAKSESLISFSNLLSTVTKERLIKMLTCIKQNQQFLLLGSSSSIFTLYMDLWMICILKVNQGNLSNRKVCWSIISHLAKQYFQSFSAVRQRLRLIGSISSDHYLDAIKEDYDVVLVRNQEAVRVWRDKWNKKHRQEDKKYRQTLDQKYLVIRCLNENRYELKQNIRFQQGKIKLSSVELQEIDKLDYSNHNSMVYNDQNQSYNKQQNESFIKEEDDGLSIFEDKEQQLFKIEEKLENILSFYEDKLSQIRSKLKCLDDNEKIRQKIRKNHAQRLKTIEDQFI